MNSNNFLDIVNHKYERMVAMVKNKVKDIMTKKVISINKNETFLEAAILMKTHDIGFLPIMEDERVIGVITDRDMVIRGIANKEDYSSVISKHMTQEIISVKSNTSIDEASNLMAYKQIKRLLIMDGNKLIGVVSLADITNHNNKKALNALIGINKKHKENYSQDNPEVDDFYL